MSRIVALSLTYALSDAAAVPREYLSGHDSPSNAATTEVAHRRPVLAMAGGGSLRIR